MARKRKQNIKETAFTLNDVTYMYYYEWLKLIAINVFKWENVPKTIDIRFMELTLFERGIAVYFNEDVLNEDYVLPVNLSGKYNLYGIPTQYNVYSSNGALYNKLNDKNSVLIFNNYLRTKSSNIVELYARKLTNIARSIDVNISAQRTPILVKCSDSQRLTMENMIMDYDGNCPFIFVDNKYNLDAMTVVNTTAPYVADKLEALLHSTLNDFLVQFGIENSNEDKKERMVSDEVQSNYGIVEANRKIRLTPRQESVEKINEMRNTNIIVSFNSDVSTLVNQFKGEMDNRTTGEGGDEIG